MSFMMLMKYIMEMKSYINVGYFFPIFQCKYEILELK